MRTISHNTSTITWCYLFLSLLAVIFLTGSQDWIHVTVKFVRSLTAGDVTGGRKVFLVYLSLKSSMIGLHPSEKKLAIIRDNFLTAFSLWHLYNQFQGIKRWAALLWLLNLFYTSLYWEPIITQAWISNGFRQIFFFFFTRNLWNMSLRTWFLRPL